MTDGLIITVLGAGASVKCGYPLTNDLFSKIEEFGDSLGENCKQLKSAVTHVIKKAKELQCDTPDDLAFRLHQLRVGTQQHQEVWRTLSYSRIATDAYFLSLEHQVTTTQLKSFKNYWHVAFGDYCDDWSRQMPPTRHRLLSFNYDRMPELALHRTFPALSGITKGHDLWGPYILNTGLGSDHLSRGYAFNDSRFCYLKLHGSVGFCPLTQEHHDFHFGDRVRRYAGLDDPQLKISDKPYFNGKLDQDGFHASTFQPLLAFPADKQRIEAGGEDYNLKEYFDKIRPLLEKMFMEAEEIRVIGYSFQAPDKDFLLRLIRQASVDTKLILHNPEAVEICDRLRVYDRIDFTALPYNW